MQPQNNFHGKHYGHNLAHRLSFSSSVSHMIPVFWDILYPGDMVSCGSELITRTQPLVTPADVDIQEHIKWIFVPITQLCQFFRDLQYGIQDIRTDMVQYVNYSLEQSADPIKLRESFKDHYGIVSLDAIRSWLKVFDPYSPSELDDTGFVDMEKERWRLLDGVGLPVRRMLYGNDEATSGMQFKPSITPWPLLAFQKWWSDKVRLTDRQLNDPRSYNFDMYMLKYVQGTTFDSTDTISRWTMPHFCPAALDYFTDVDVSPVFSVTDVNSLSNQQSDNGVNIFAIAKQWLADSVEPSIINNTNSPVTPEVISSLGLSVENANQSFANPAMIRTMFATEKVLEVSRRAGKHYDKQTLAHFGVKPNEGISGEAVEFGDDVSEIHIKDVEATAETEGTPLGALAGKGYGYGRTSRYHKFKANEHGILLAVYFSIPRIDYRQTGLPKLFTYSYPYDFALPEFDRLGKQPLFAYESDLFISAGQTVNGWQDRYAESKRRYNRVFGALGSSSMSSWTTSRIAPLNASVGQYLINPNFLNPIMVQDYENNQTSNRLSVDNTIEQNYNLIYEGDPFIHYLTLDVKKSSFMSKFGTPSL